MVLEKKVLEKDECIINLQKELERYKEGAIRQLNQMSESFEEITYSTAEAEEEE